MTPKRRATMITILWSIAGPSATALLFGSDLERKTIIIAAVLLLLSLISLAFVYGMFHAPRPIGIAPKAVLVLLGIVAIVGLLAWNAWPQSTFVYIKPGVWLNPDTPNAEWMFIPVVRGPREVRNVNIVISVSPSDDEHRNIALGKGEPPTIHYDELDPSTVKGLDREADKFLYSTGNKRYLHFEFIIRFRRGKVLESLEMYTPSDRTDWQYRMSVVWNGTTQIDCRDPRFPLKGNGNESELPQCFPEYEGRLSK